MSISADQTIHLDGMGNHREVEAHSEVKSSLIQSSISQNTRVAY